MSMPNSCLNVQRCLEMQNWILEKEDGMKCSICGNGNVWEGLLIQGKENGGKNASLSSGEAKIQRVGGEKGASKDEMKGWSMKEWQNQESKNKIVEAKTGSVDKRIIKNINFKHSQYLGKLLHFDNEVQCMSLHFPKIRSYL